MEQQSVFTEQNPAPVQDEATPTSSEAQTPPQSVNLFEDQLKQITAEDGRQKYSTVDKALDALAHSQTLIPTLQSEKAMLEDQVNKLREELAQRQSVHDTVEQLATPHQQQDETGNPSQAPLGEEEIARLVESTLEKRTQQQIATDNQNKVDQALRGSFGDKAPEVVARKAAELNTTPEELGALAARSPDLVLTLFNQTGKPSTLNTTTYNIHNGPKKDQELVRPEKSLLAGSSAKDQVDYMKRVKESIYKKYEIT